MKKVTQRRRAVLAFFPVYGLQMVRDGLRELRIDRVTFVASTRIPRIRKRLGFPKPLSEYRLRRMLFAEADVYALVNTSKRPDDRDYSAERRLARDAVWILAGTFLSHVSREDTQLSLAPGAPDRLVQDLLAFDRKSGAAQASSRLYSPVQPARLDSFWSAWTKRDYLWPLLSVLHGDVKVASGWREALRRAAILAGQSQMARNLPVAFLHVMIALETLLVEQGEPFPGTLTKRLDALFGWLSADTQGTWGDVIERLYRLRCSFVHDGQSGQLTALDLHNAETLLVNVMTNIVRNCGRLSSKKAVIEHSRRVEARKILGRRPWTKDVPLTFSYRHLSSRDAQRLRGDQVWMW